MKEYEFDAVLIKKEGMNATFIEFPYDVEKEFGTKGRIKVHVTFDNTEYRGSLVKGGIHTILWVLHKKYEKK